MAIGMLLTMGLSLIQMRSFEVETEDQLNQQNHLIDLITNQDKNSLRYTQFLIFIETSLVTAFVYLHKSSLPNSEILPLISGIIPIVGGLIPYGIFWIILRQFEWQRYLRERYNEPPTGNKTIFPLNEEIGFKAYDIKKIRIIFWRVAISISVGWYSLYIIFDVYA